MEMVKQPKARSRMAVAMALMPDVLEDLLQDSLRIIMCGTAVSTESAAAGAYYAQAEQILEDFVRDRTYA
jgi:hypothetical protein